MNNQQNIHELEKEINEFPKLKMDDFQKKKLHQRLMLEANKYERTSRKNLLLKRVTVSLTALAAAILTIFIGLSYFNQSEKVPHQGTTKPPVTNENVHPLASIFQTDEGSKLTARTNKVTGQDVQYETNDSELLRQFQESLLAMDFKETDQSNTVFITTYQLFNSDEKLILSIEFTGENIARFNGKTYLADEEKLAEFEKLFFQEKYLPSEVPESERDVIERTSKNVIEVIVNKHISKLAHYVHPTKGVILSPYVFIQDDAIILNAKEVEQMFEDTKVYTWGTHAGSGMPIQLTKEQYFDQYLYDQQFQFPDELNINNVKQRGTMVNELQEKFPGSYIVEYHLYGKENELAWKSINLIFEKDQQGEWKLIAIVNDQWTP